MEYEQGIMTARRKKDRRTGTRIQTDRKTGWDGRMVGFDFHIFFRHPDTTASLKLNHFKMQAHYPREIQQ